jgi:hypothetical protein
MTMIADKLRADVAIARCATATTAEIDGQLVALDINSGVCFGLNRAATRIWQLIETPRTPTQVSTALLEVYDVDPDVCAAEVLSLLQELVDIGLARIDG